MTNHTTQAAPQSRRSFLATVSAFGALFATRMNPASATPAITADPVHLRIGGTTAPCFYDPNVRPHVIAFRDGAYYTSGWPLTGAR